MINTKLILVDGITGSGKSTTAHYIARQLKRNGIKVKWYYEEEKGHPFHLPKVKKKKKESDIEFCRREMTEFVKAWKILVKKIKNDDTVYIIESFFFQDNLLEPLMNDFDKQEIKTYSYDISNTMKTLNPTLIHFYQKDVGKSMRRNWNRRGEQWKNWLIGREANTPFCKNRKIKGNKAPIALWNELTNISKELYDELDFKKIQIENSKQDWKKYRKDILDFLQVEQKEEILFHEDFEKYCDEYLGKGYLLKIHKKDERLCIDAFWPNLKLLPVSKNEFEIEGFPISMKFYRYRNKKKLKILKAGCYYKEGGVSEKYIPHKMKKNSLDKFCKVYWCEADKLERKIYVKDGKLYYWREKWDESLLIPTSNTQFIMMASVENTIKFKKEKGEWQFAFDIKGNEPKLHKFLPKKGKE